MTELDERVLAQLSTARGRRARVIAFWVFYRSKHRYWDGYAWRPSDAQVAEVRRVLRGLEHLGRASGRGGWWRAT